MSAGLLRLLLPALLVVGGAAAGLAQTMPNRASEYAAGAPPWLRYGIERALDVDFEGNDRPYRVEWRRCGPRRAEWSPDGKITYPSHYVVVTLDRASPTPLVVFDNADEPDTAHIESARTARFTRDRRPSRP
jgi:hypothetical protein